MSSSDDLVDALFRECLDRAEDGHPIDEAEVLARAGADAPELARRLKALRDIHALADTFVGAGDEEGEPPITRLGRFENLRPIGSGGSARVFAARDPDLGRDVALKILDLDPTRDRAWLEREGRSLAQLSHRGVVRVFELGSADGRAFVAMELVRGPTLARVIEALRGSHADEETARAARALAPFRARVALALELADALAACHESGVVHRDVKPHNVVLDAGTRAQWIDFGLAHADGAATDEGFSGRFVATPAYAAPEQIEHGATGASAASDQWSFGVLAYELLALEHPFLRATRAATLAAIANSDPTPLRALVDGLPADLEAIVARALVRDPRARHPSMRALANDLEAFLELRPVRARPRTRVELALLWSRRHRRDMLLAGGALAFAAGVGLVASMWTNAREDRAFFAALAAMHKRNSATPLDFATKYERLGALAREAGRLDQRWVGLHGLSERVHAAIEETSRALAVAFRASWDECGHAAPEEIPRLRREAVLAFRPALSRDEELCPTCPWNVVDRERGRIDLPALGAGETLRIWRLARLARPGAARLELLPPETRLDIGIYRVQRVDRAGGLVCDIEIFVRPEDPRHELELTSIDASWRARCRRVGEWIEPARDVRGEIVRAFWISPEPLTWVDIERAGARTLADARRARIEATFGPTAVADAAPALLTPAEARSVATTLGARLPTLLELDSARAQGALTPFAPAPHVIGEHVGGPGTTRGIIAARLDGSLCDIDEDVAILHTREGPGAFVLRLAFQDAP